MFINSSIYKLMISYANLTTSLSFLFLLLLYSSIHSNCYAIAHLHEYITYYCSYRSSRGAGRGGNRSIGGDSEESRESGNPNRDREKDREVEGRYGELYEQRMNPFAEVRRCTALHCTALFSYSTLPAQLHCFPSVLMIMVMIRVR
jgi:hypothetical protein